MDITAKKYNLLRLWIESFVVVNKCTGKLVKAVLCSLLLVGVVLAVLLVGVGTSALFAHLHMTLLAQTVGIGTLLVYIIAALASNLYGIFFLTVIWNIVASHVLQRTQPLSELFSSSILPTVYQFASVLIVGIPFMVVFVVLTLGARTTPWLFAVGGILLFMVSVRLCYSFIAIAVDHKGPIEGLTYSWELTSGKNYIDALLFCLLQVGSVLLLEAIYVAIGYGLYVLIPLHFSQSFSLANPSPVWWLAGGILLVLSIFYCFVIMTFPVLVFLNRTMQGIPNEQLDQNNIFIPLPELELPQSIEHGAPAHLVQTQSTLPTVENPETPRKPLTPVELPTAPSTTEELKISQTSVNTSDEDVNEITQHLHQVYTPKAEGIVQYREEDRMPTILFDDEMAKQLLEQHGLSEQPETPSNENSEGNDSIEMSK